MVASNSLLVLVLVQSASLVATLPPSTPSTRTTDSVQLRVARSTCCTQVRIHVSHAYTCIHARYLTNMHTNMHRWHICYTPQSEPRFRGMLHRVLDSLASIGAGVAVGVEADDDAVVHNTYEVASTGSGAINEKMVMGASKATDLAPLLHASFGLDHYPNYLQRWDLCAIQLVHTHTHIYIYRHTQTHVGIHSQP